MENITPAPELSTNHILAQLVQALGQVIPQQTRSRFKCLVQFYGQSNEDPHVFLNKLKEYFTKNQIAEDEERLEIAADRLGDKALKWFEQYYTMLITYAEFSTLFLAQFNSPAARSAAKTKLYSECQKTEESTEPFIIMKKNLFNRLNENVPEQEQIGRL